MPLLKAKVPAERLPRHLAIIMDGNGRWAKRRLLPRQAGHRRGAQVFRTITRYCSKRGIAYLTVYAFSTENWKRPQSEVDAIMDLLKEYLIDALENFKEENIKTNFIGDRSKLDPELRALMAEAEDSSSHKTGMQLNIAINYGGRQEIVTAIQQIFAQKQGTKAWNLTETEIEKYLYTAGQPDPDLIIRPSGEYRLSNFLLWQSAYAEYWFSHTLWPDFTPHHLEQAFHDYDKRNRRFGGV